jgi:outer membrane cobalamin receptor
MLQLFLSVVFFSFVLEPAWPYELFPIAVGENTDEDELEVRAHKTQALNQHANTYSLGEQLNQQAGITSTQQAAPGVREVISIRSRAGSNVLVFIEEMAINQINDLEVDLSNFSQFFFERVNIYASSTPIELGAGKGGGAIQFKLNQKNQINLSHASFNHNTINLLHANDSMLVGFNYEHAVNNFSFINDNGTPLNTADDFKDNRSNASFEKINLLLHKRYKLNQVDGKSLILFNQKKQALPDDLNSPINESSLSRNNGQLFNQFKWRGLSYQIGAGIDKQLFNDEKASLGLGSQKNTYETKQFWNQINYTQTMFDIIQFKAFLLKGRSRLSETDEINITQAKYHTDETQLGSSISYFYKSNILTFETVKREIEYLDQYSLSRHNWAVSNQIELNPKWVIEFRISSEYRLPSLSELYINSGILTPNTDLTSENVKMQEVNIKFNQGSFQFNGSIYQGDFENKIVWTFDARGIGRPVNIEASQNKGAELNFSYDFNPMYLKLNINSQKPINTANHKVIAGEFKSSYSIEAGINKKYLSSSIIYQQANDIYFDTNNLRPGRNVKSLDWITAHQLTKDTSFRWAIKNLLNHQNQLNNGFPAPLRLFFTGLSVNY